MSGVHTSARRSTMPIRLACGVALVVALGGCGESGQTQSESPHTVPAVRSGPDLARGEILSFACQACHALTLAGGPDIGPSLYGMFGRPAASLPDFQYSDALRSVDFIWTAERLDAWLQAPTDFLPGTTMAFAGYGNAQDRESLIAWLESATAPAER